MLSWVRFSRSILCDENFCASDLFKKCYQEKLVKEWETQERKPSKRDLRKRVVQLDSSLKGALDVSCPSDLSRNKGAGPFIYQHPSAVD